MALYGQQDPRLVDAAICKGKPGERRVIFCTNVAETSLTIEGVTVVVDAGFNKEAVYDHQKHMTVLQVVLAVPTVCVMQNCHSLLSKLCTDTQLTHEFKVVHSCATLSVCSNITLLTLVNLA